MSAYTPHSARDVSMMLADIGVSRVEDLFSSIPERLRSQAHLALDDGLTESELRREIEALAGRNAGAETAVFLGAGAYPHAVPALVDQILLRSEFATAYTPYQPEVSQGTLQSIFEFQTFAAMLLGLEVANASMYDGASATAEAVLMARRLLPGRRVIWMARSVHPQYRATVATYVRRLPDVEVREFSYLPNGLCDLEELERSVGDDALCVVLGYPNVFGVLEDVEAVAVVAQRIGALTITATPEALALATIRSPGACGADIAVAEGQSFGLPVSYGGPGVGLFATQERHLRSMPGRVVGETVDGQGRRGYVLTLAAREQHIRRERATSNICTNQGLCALAVTVYLSLLGRSGLRSLGRGNFQAAHIVADRLQAAGVTRIFEGPFFNEFVVDAPGTVRRWEALARDGVVPGYPLERWYPELKGALLVCVTEVHSPDQIDRLVSAITTTSRETRMGG